MALPSIDAFLELVTKSGVVEPSRLTAYVDSLRAENAVPTETGKLAALMVRDAILSQFQAEQLLAGRWRGFFVGKYKVLERLGSGGMGTVYMAEHRIMKRRVALKVLPRSRAGDQAALERFRREAVAVAALNHPNIVRAFDHDQDGDLHFLVMEHVDGISLHDLVNAGGPLDVHRACHYIYQAARGMEHAHAVGMVHRDIKPGNLLVDRGGIVKLLDMGLARFFNDEGESITKKFDENVLGTADYLAPEQALDSHSVDIRADIYSLGGTFYYLVAGKSPFGEGTIAQKLIWHQTRRPKPLKEIRPDVPDAVAAIIEKMMAKNADDRYASPGELLQVLEPLVQEPLAPLPDQFLPQLSPAARAAGSDLLPATDTSLPRFGSGTTPAPSSKPGTTPTPQRMNPPAANPIAASASPSPSLSGSEAARTLVSSSGEETSAVTAVNANPGTTATEDPDFVWSALGSKPVAEPLVKVKPRPKPVAKPPEAPASETAPRKAPGTPWLWIGLGGGGLLLAGLIILVVFKFLRSDGVSTGPSPNGDGNEPKTWYVSAHGEADQRSIKEAVAAAKAGDRIVVRKGTILKEKVDLRGADGKVKSIEAEEGEATIQPPDGHVAGGPLVAIQDVPRLHFTGFKLDGQSKCDTLLKITGDCSGLQLSGLQLTAFDLQGIQLDNALGRAKAGEQISLRKISIVCPGEEERPALSGIEFVSGRGKKCDHVHLEKVDFKGRMEAGLRIRARVENLLVQDCTFMGGQFNAILYPIGVDETNHVFKIKLANNRFSDYRAAIRIDAVVPIGSKLDLQSNQFDHITEALLFSTQYAAAELEGWIVGEGNEYSIATCKTLGVLKELADLTARKPADVQFKLTGK